MSFAVSPYDKRIAYAIFDYTSGGPAVSISIRDLVGGGNKVDLYSSPNNAEWPVAWNEGNLVLAVGSSQAAQPSDPNPFAVPNPYNAGGGYKVVDTTHSPGAVLDTIPAECACGLLVGGGTPCWRAASGPGFRDWAGRTTWYPNSLDARYSFREALSPDGLVAATTTLAGSNGAWGVGAFDSTSLHQRDAAFDIQGRAVPMGWLSASRLVVRHFNGSSTVTIVDLHPGTATDVAVECGPSSAPVPCTDLVMFGTL